MAMPTDRKYGFVCPPEHIDAFREFLQRAPAVLVIGTQGLDRDLMDSLGDAHAPSSRAPAAVVDCANVAAIAARFSSALDTEFTMYDARFRDFVHSERLKAFLENVKAA